MSPILPHLGSRSYAILLALSDGDRHGYELMRQIALDSGSRLSMGPATLYTSLKRLLELSLIEELPEREDEAHGVKRRYYRLSPTGKAALEGELERSKRFVSLAQRRLA